MASPSRSQRLGPQDRSAIAPPVVEAQEPVAQRLLGRPLDGGVERGLDLQAFVVEPVDAVGLLEVLAHLLGEERADLRLPRGARHHQRAGDRLGMLTGGDEALGEHPVEHVVAARHHLGPGAGTG